MSLGGWVKKVWMHPLANLDRVDDDAVVECHRRIIKSKPLLYRNYLKWYRECLPAFRETGHLSGPMIEIGSGAGFLDEVIPGIIRTDIAASPFTDRVVDAMRMDFADESVRAFFLIGVLHHLPEPGRFIAEAERCLMLGGRLVMVEPNNSWLERVLCRFLDHYEYLDPAAVEWKNKDANRLSHANLALPWIMCIRDRERFDREFRHLKFKSIHYHTFIAYMVTGGMSFRSFLPGFAWPLVAFVEWLAAPFMKHLGTVMTIDLEKTV